MSYDDEEPPYKSSESPSKRKKRGWIIPVLLGVIIGILLVSVALPALSKSSLLPSVLTDKTDKKTENGEMKPRGDSELKQSISVDVSTQITKAVEEVNPAVVGVTNLQKSEDLWKPKSNREAEDGEVSVGSGVIYKKNDKDAFVVTNHHVIDGADMIEVVLSDDTRVKATLLGSDLFTDLAILKMDAKDVKKVIEIGTSHDLKVGEPAIAIGNPLGLMFAGSVTQGVISGTERTVPQDFNNDGRPDWQAEVIQTDAAINPGNSGGALINMAGQLIGINSMKINQTAVEGIGFAIPIDSAIPIMDQLEKKGEVTRPYLGIEAYALEEVPKIEWEQTLKLPKSIEGGIYLLSVEGNSPASEAGLRKLDVITEMDGKDIKDMIELRQILYEEKKTGDEVKLTYYRDGEKKQATVQLAKQK